MHLPPNLPFSTINLVNPALLGFQWSRERMVGFYDVVVKQIAALLARKVCSNEGNDIFIVVIVLVPLGPPGGPRGRHRRRTRRVNKE